MENQLNKTEHAILNGLCTNEEYVRKALPFLKSEYFSNPADNKIFKIAGEYFTKYDRLPTPEIIAIEVNNSNMADGVHKDCIGLLERFNDKPNQTQWLMETTEKFCRDKAVTNAIMKSITIMDGSEKKLSRDAIPGLLEDALAVSFDTAVGHDYFMDAGARFDLYSHTESKIPCDLNILNKITKGGIPKKTLNLVMGGTNSGKSLFLCHLAAAYMKQGLNVLYITMEMAEERIAERIDANLLDVAVDDIRLLQKETFVNKVNKLQSKTHGKLVIKEYPTTSAHAGHFKSLINELRIKKEFDPTVVIIDYLSICSSAKYTNLNNTNSYTLVKSVAEELRSLAVSEDVLLWSAGQLNRAGMGSSDISLTDTSESIGLSFTADFMIAIAQSEEMAQMGQMLVKQLKNRYGSKDEDIRFVLGVDKPKMTFYDVETSGQNISQPNTNSGKHNHSSSKVSESDKYSKFNF